jgi:hypothetical protein
MVEHKYATLTGDAARRQGGALAEDRNGLAGGRREGLLDQCPVEAPIGEYVVQRCHHFGLGHDGQAGEVGQVDEGWLDAREAPAVKW